jgi:glycosyltransferase involved in cell wall biosynthesis
LREYVPRIQQLSEPFSLEETELEPDVSAAIPAECDLVHLHWVAGYMDYPRFFARLRQRGIPVIWTLWDMNPFTGGCHFDRECGRFAEECGCCPLLHSSHPQDLSQEILLAKIRALQDFPTHQLTLATPCQWMTEQAAQSRLFSRFSSRVIHTGADVALFIPIPQATCRQILKLDPTVLTILFVSDDTTNTRKGATCLLEALRLVRAKVKGVHLVLVGAGTLPIDDMPNTQLGRIADRRLLPLVYNAADVFVCPSLQDNLPNTLLEAMSCGVPPVAFACGGIPELVQHGVNGLLAETGNAVQLANSLIQILEDSVYRRRLGEAAAKTLREHFAMEAQVTAYAALYQEVLTQTKRKFVH